MEVPPDLGPLFGRLAIRVVRASADSIEQDAQRCAEQDNVLEEVVELPLVAAGARDDQVRVRGKHSGHAWLVPVAVGEFPPVVVGTAVALYAFPLATARARSERMPIWLVLPVVGMQLWAGFQTGPSTWIGWVILADGLVLLTAVSLARHRLRQTRA